MKTKRAPIGTLIISLGLLVSFVVNLHLVFKYENAAARLSAIESLKKKVEDKSETYYEETTYRDLVELYAGADRDWGVETPLLTVESVEINSGFPDILVCYSGDPSQRVFIQCPRDYVSGLYREGDLIKVKGVSEKPSGSLNQITLSIDADEITYVDHTTLETTENKLSTLAFEEYVKLCVPLDAEKAVNNPDEYRDAYVQVTGSVVSTSIDSLLGSFGGVVEVQIISDDTRYWVSYYREDDAYHSFQLGQKVTFYAQLNGNKIRRQPNYSAYYLTPDILAMYYSID